jgi:hypothetical protein
VVKQLVTIRHSVTKELEPEGKMRVRMEHFPEKTPNPAPSVEKDGKVINSN